MNKLIVVGAFASLFGVSLSAGQPASGPAANVPVASSPAATAPAGDISRWRGQVLLPDGSGKLEFSVSLTGNGDATSGTMSIPMQGVKDAQLKECRVDGKSIKFTLGLPGMPRPAWAHFEAMIGDDANQATGTLKQGAAELPLTMVRLAKDEPAEKGRPQDPKPPFPYTQRNVMYANAADGAKLGGTLTIPESAKFGKGPFAVALLITGSGAQNRDEELLGHRPFLVIADYLTRAGIAVLRVDDRGVGESTSPKQGAETTLDFATDVRAGVEFLRTQPEIDAARIGLIGHSEGGLIAPLVAADTRDVAFIVMLAGTGVNGHQILVEQMGAILQASGVAKVSIDPIQLAQDKALTAAEAGKTDELNTAIRELATLQAALGNQPLNDEQMNAAVNAAAASFASPWMMTFLKLDPREALAKVKCPVLVLNGGLDAQVVARQNVPEIVRALLAGGNQNVTVRVFPNLNHLFQTCKTGGTSEYEATEETFAPVALDEMARWIGSVAIRKSN